MENALVTGGCGFIASHFINYLHKRYPDINIINVDKLDYCSNVENVTPGAATFVKGNVGNAELMEHLIKLYNFKYIFHFAAQSHVDNSFDNAMSFTMDNTHATHVLIEACRHFIPDVEFVHFSTDEVYGENKTTKPFKENQAQLRPTNPYSASKAAAEMIVHSYIKSFGMNVKIIRCNNVYGPRQYPEKLIPKFKRLLKEGKKCTIHGTNAANTKRAFLHVDDVVEAVDIIWLRGETGEIYNVSSDDEMTVLDVTKLIIEASVEQPNYEDYITYTEDRPHNDERYWICSQKLKDLGWVQKRKRDDLINFIKEL